ncbi:MAG: hypothetical protein QNK31_13425 [Porticoccus sp.]|nr:hypothetical protein [Porticoccus sp.]
MRVIGSRLYLLHQQNLPPRSGTVWEGRHKSSLVDADNYLLQRYRYREWLNVHIDDKIFM